MYKITDVSGNEKYIIKLYNFFDMLGNSVMPNKKRYVFLNKIGKSYAILKNDKIIGGLVISPEKLYNVIINFYIPEDSRKTMQSLRVLELVMEFSKKNGNKPIIFRCEDVSDFKQMVKPLDKEKMIYQLLIPKHLER